MPEPYSNPDVTPCIGTYTWVPTTPQNFGGLNFTTGFSSLIIDRGSFRNYWYRNLLEKNILVRTFSDNTLSGSPYNPVKNATRPLALGFPVKIGNGDNVAISGVKIENLIEFDFLADSQKRLSCIQINYDLSVFANDDNYNFDLAPSPPAVLVYGKTSSGAEELIATDVFSGLPLTRVRNVPDESNLVSASNSSSPGSGSNFVNFKIKIKEEILDRSKFPQYKSIIFKINPAIISLPSSLVFVIKKIMFFTADRVNFRFAVGSDQLPCKALGYSMAIDGKFIPALALGASIASAGGSSFPGISVGTTGLFFWPVILQDNCNIDVKLFNPDFVSNSPGFAHSLNLHIYVYTMPFFGPLGDFFLPGVIQPYFGVIMGPKTFTQQWIFYGNSNNKNLQLAVMNSALFKKNSGIVALQQDNNIVGEIKEIRPLVSGFESIIKNQFYYEQLGISTSGNFKNDYIDEFGIKSQSETYNGSVPRKSPFTALEPVADFPRTSKKQFSYSTFLFEKEPNLFRLFTESDPCLLFKCSSATGFSDSIFIEPGFLYASVNCFATDVTGMFDSRLVYRFFLVPKDTPPLANPESKTIKIKNSGFSDSSVSVELVDDKWDFTNVLCSGIIVDSLNTVETSEIINQSLRGFSPFGGKPYDLYCGVYAMSNLNDSFAGYDLEKYSTLDLPTVTFSINNDFIIQLPIYYRKTYSNGGTLQAQRDFGLKGQYVADELSYTIITEKYNGSSASSGVYNGSIDSFEGVNGLFTFVGVSTAPPEKTKFLIQAGVGITETDYVLLVESTSNARINSGEWILQFNVNIAKGGEAVEAKFEVDLVDRNSSNLILRVLSSEFQSIFAAVGDKSSEPPRSKANITVPFFLPQVEGLLVLRILLRNNKPILNKPPSVVTISVDKIILEKNTLEQFSFIPQQTRNYLIGFYEDLPIQPSFYSPGCQSFILKLDYGEGTVLYDPMVGLTISGVVYSPTWAVDLPENMELKYNATQINGDRTGSIVDGVGPYKIFFRTGLSNDVKIIDTKRHQNGLIVTMANTKTNTSDNAIQQIVSESFFRFTTYTDKVTTPLSNFNLVELDLKNPILSKSDNNNIQLALSGQNLNSDKITTLLFNNEAPGYYSSQPSDGGTFMPIDNPGYVVSKATNCAITTFDFKDNKSNNVGVTAGGNLIYSVNQSSSTSQATNYTLVEGDPANNNTNQELGKFEGLYIATGLDNQYVYCGPTQVTFPGILLTSQNCVVFYVFAKTNSLSSQAKANRDSLKIKPGTAIYGRFLSGARVSTVFLVFDFEGYCEQNGKINFDTNEFPIINQITVCKSDVYPYGESFNLAFDCAGKIFVLRSVFTQNNTFTSGLGIVYGNLETSSNAVASKFLSCLNNMVSNSSLYKFRYEDRKKEIKTFYNKDLEFSQKVGFVDFDGVYMGVQFYIGSDIYEIVIDKSYVLVGEYRTIGEINQ
jgi:hypothetical protein